MNEIKVHLRLAILVPLVALLSCATLQPTGLGSVVMKIDGTEAHIRMPDNAVAAGDRVQFLRQRCSGTGKLTRCLDEPTGEGEVVQLLNAHYAVVRVRCGVEFDEGDRVARLRPRLRGGEDAPERFSQNEERSKR